MSRTYEYRTSRTYYFSPRDHNSHSPTSNDYIDTSPCASSSSSLPSHLRSILRPTSLSTTYITPLPLQYTCTPCITLPSFPCHYGPQPYTPYFIPVPSVPTSSTSRLYVNDGRCDEPLARVIVEPEEDRGRNSDRDGGRGRKVRDRTPTPYHEDHIRPERRREQRRRSSRERSRVGERERERVVQYEYIEPVPVPIIRERIIEYVNSCGGGERNGRVKNRSRERERSIDRVSYVIESIPRARSRSRSRDRRRTVYYVDESSNRDCGRREKNASGLDSDEDQVERKVRIRRRYSVRGLNEGEGVRFRV